MERHGEKNILCIGEGKTLIGIVHRTITFTIVL